jgi:hypothetical protein
VTRGLHEFLVAEPVEVLLGSQVSQTRGRINNVAAVIITICTLSVVTAARNYLYHGVIIPSSEDKP